MHKKLRRAEWLALALVVTSFVAAIIALPLLPARVPSHWNAAGEIDGYMPRGWGAFFMPVLSLVILAILVIFPRIDPKRENIEKFRPYFDDFILAFLVFMSYFHLLTLAAGVGFTVNIVMPLVPAFAILFFVLGRLISHAEPNWTVGIRTPWTLSSETVWRKTHEMGGKLFRAAAVVGLLGLLFPSAAIWFILVPILGTALTTVVYSYVEFRKEKRAMGNG